MFYKKEKRFTIEDIKNMHRILIILNSKTFLIEDPDVQFQIQKYDHIGSNP